jgi:LPXTG-motif cell wall-anchored protein
LTFKPFSAIISFNIFEGGIFMRKAASHGSIIVKFSAIILAALVMLMFSTNAAANGNSTRITAKALLSHSCDANEWHFVITQIDDHSDVPATIDVTWANGAHEVVPTNKYTGKTAHYTTTSNLNSEVTEAYTYIYNGWTGQFNLSHGPCLTAASPVPNATVNPTVNPTVAPTAVPTAVATATPTVQPTVAPSATASAVPVVGSVSTPSNPSDGRSDGLGCSVRDCSGNVIPTVTGVVAGVSTDATLPSTGANPTGIFLLGIAGLLLGMALVSFANKEEIKFLKK